MSFLAGLSTLGGASSPSAHQPQQPLTIQQLLVQIANKRRQEDAQNIPQQVLQAPSVPNSAPSSIGGGLESLLSSAGSLANMVNATGSLQTLPWLDTGANMAGWGSALASAGGSAELGSALTSLAMFL